MKLTEHFTLEEFVISREAVSRRIDNTPTEEIKKNLQFLAENMEIVRGILKFPIYIISGYRCPDLNFAVRGSKTSQHMDGLACDFVCPGFGNPYKVCRALEDSGLEFDQMIFELQNWVHISFVRNNPRKSKLTICRPNEGYRQGILNC